MTDNDKTWDDQTKYDNPVAEEPANLGEKAEPSPSGTDDDGDHLKWKLTTCSYENLVAICPSCQREVVFNRISDLGTPEPVGGSKVGCEHCGATHWMTGDSVNQAHEMLLFDCGSFFEEKRYMLVVLTLAQAHEVFCGIYLRAELLFRPFGLEADADLNELNKLAEELFAGTRKWPFDQMRWAVLWHLLNFDRPHQSLQESRTVFRLLLSVEPGAPKDAALQTFREPKLREVALGLKSSGIGGLRNKVVHSQGYRPNREETEEMFEKARQLLHPASELLQVFDDAEWYRAGCAKPGVSRIRDK